MALTSSGLKYYFRYINVTLFNLEPQIPTFTGSATNVDHFLLSGINELSSPTNIH